MRRAAATVALVMGLALAGLPAGGADDPIQSTGGDPAGEFSLLVFTKTVGFRHGSIPAGAQALQQLGAEKGFAVDVTDDAAAFTDEGLSGYAAVLFLSTDGDVLDESQQEAFQRYIRGGGGYVGVHAASATEYDWPWYEGLVGAYFERHPAIQRATINVDDRVHPSTAHLPARWEWTDEWYDHRSNPRGDVHVLMTVDESTYSGGGEGIDHPIAWCQDYDGGRSWYTAIGHNDAHFSDAAYLQHLLGGIQTAAGVVGAECGATVEANFTKTPVDTDTLKPIRVQVAPDGRVFYLEQAGQVKVYDPATDTITVAADFVADRGIYNGHENGTVGIALDPDFTDNGWVYLYYSPAAEATEPQRVTGRFGRAVPLSGNAEYVELPTGVVSELEDFTIATWVNPSQVSTWQRIFDFGHDTTTHMFLTASAGSAPRFAITTGGNAAGQEQQINGVAPLPADQWTHIAVTLQGSTGTLHVNGVPVATNSSMTLSPSDLGETTRNWIGRSQYPDPYLNAMVDEFQIYDRALSTAELLAFQTSATGTAGRGDVASYSFDEQTGGLVADGSGNGQDARVFANSSVACPETERANASCGEVRLSRFTMVGDTLDLDSEAVLLRVGHQRDTCCHTTGDMTFDSQGNLYLSTGDDTNPWESSGYSPIDERSGRNAFDAQRTSANTNDLRGKIIRIHPEDDGTYTIPEGNLIDTLDLSDEERALVRPEIYAMGLRNPFTITVDPATDALIVADYGPDASLANPVRGPEGRVEINYLTEAANLGWPYCVAENTPYVDHVFLSSVAGAPVPALGNDGLHFNCDAPVNDSPNNTGLRELPPAQPSTMYQSIATGSAPAHALGHGSAPMTGPVFTAADAAGPGGLPAYYDGAQFFMDWNKGQIFEIRRDDDRTIRTINRVMPSMAFKRPLEMAQHPDGSLYLIEWGMEQFFGPNTDSGLYRISYDAG